MGHFVEVQGVLPGFVNFGGGVLSFYSFVHITVPYTVFLTLETTRSFVIIVGYFLLLHFLLKTLLYASMINNEQEKLHIIISQKAITYTVSLLEGHYQ